jgi:serine/threonine protein kinase
MKPLNPNSMIQGRYLIVQSIGKGGMGEVYLAVDQRLGSAVALKRTFFSEDSTLGSAFEREARILARLRHPVLPKVIDHFAENGDQFLVMEHISGDDISKRLENANKPFPVSWVMFWADQMLDALAYLHSHEPPIVHRDIKPQNLKLTDDNHIVLLDFGLSKDFDSAASSGHGLNSASVAGYSPHFASMEQIRGTGTDARSDLYSLSATLYQMLTNTIPPDALTRADALIGGKADPILPLYEVNPEISPAISEVILKAISIRQDERFATAVEMQKTLRRAFNKDKADPDAKPVMSITNPQQPPPDTSTQKPKNVEPEAPESPEMETRARNDVGLPLDATLQFEAAPTLNQVKQSELQTAIFTADELVPADAHTEPRPVTAEPVPVVAASVAAAAAAPGATPPKRPSPMAPPAHQKKSSKAGLIAGVLVGLFLLAGIGGAAGWYLLKGSNAGAVTSPTPSAASPSPSPAVLADANKNVDSNSDVVSGSNTSIADSNSVSSTAPPETETRPTPQVTTKGTPAKTTGTPTAKATPKPKAKDDRTVILQ